MPVSGNVQFDSEERHADSIIVSTLLYLFHLKKLIKFALGLPYHELPLGAI